MKLLIHFDEDVVQGSPEGICRRMWERCHGCYSRELAGTFDRKLNQGQTVVHLAHVAEALGLGIDVENAADPYTLFLDTMVERNWATRMCEEEETCGEGARFKCAKCWQTNCLMHKQLLRKTEPNPSPSMSSELCAQCQMLQGTERPASTG